MREFEKVLRCVKINDANLQADTGVWRSELNESFDSFLFMCIGTVCNSLFESYVERQLAHNSAAFVQRRRRVLNLFVFLAHLSGASRALHCDCDRRTAYARYYVRNVKHIYMKKIADLIATFGETRRFVTVDRVLRYVKRALVYTELKSALDVEVTVLVEYLALQIDTAAALGDTTTGCAPSGET